MYRFRSPERLFAQKPLAALVSLMFASAPTLAQDDPGALPAIVVSASGYGQNIQDAPATVTVISAEEIAKRSYTDLADVLKSVPGVVVQGSGTEQSISIRGMGNAYTLFLIDGRPAQGGDTFEFNGGGRGQQISFMPPLEMIERIEVVRGPASGLYGSDAMGGVVNIITKKVAARWGGGLTTEFIEPHRSNEVNGSAHNSSFVLNGPLVSDVLGLQISGGYRATEESDVPPFGDSTTGDADYTNKNLGTKLSWKLDGRNTITLGGSHTMTSRTRHPGRSLAATATAPTFQESTKNNLFLTHDGDYGQLVTTSYLNYDDANNPTTRTSAPSGKARGVDFRTLTLNGQATYMLNDRHTLTGGLNYKDEELKDGATSAVNPYNEANDAYVVMQRYQASAFLEEEWRVLDQLALTVSGRYDHNEQYGGHFSPKAYVVYQPTDELTLKGGVLTGYRAPSLRNSAPDFSATSMGGVSIGNPDLKPETSRSVELGLAWDSRRLGLRTSAVVYKTDFKNKITRSSEFLCLPNVACVYDGRTYPAHPYGYKQTINVDEAEIKGLELTLDYQLTRQLALRSNYTRTDSEQLTGANKGSPLNDQPKHTANLGLSWDATGSTNLWLQAAYIGKFISTDLATSASTSQSYTIADIGVVHRPTEQLALKFGVYNLADREIANSANGYVDGRRYSASASYSF